MSGEPVWLTPDELKILNAAIVARTLEPYQVFDEDRIASACERPRNAYLYDGQDDIVALAALQLVAISKAHGFLQGNKRLGLVGAELFLRNNGYSLRVPDIKAISDLVYAATQDHVTPDQLADEFDPYVQEWYEDEDLAHTITTVMEQLPEGPIASFDFHAYDAIPLDELGSVTMVDFARGRSPLDPEGDGSE